MDKVLKQRLVGATILIALAVIFVPMLFQSPDRDVDRASGIDVPEEPGEALETRRLAMDPERARQREETDPPEEAQVPEPEPVDPEAPDAEPVPDLPEAQPEVPEEEPFHEAPPEIDGAPETEPEPEPEPDPEPEPEPEPEAEPDLAEMTGWLVQVASFGSSESAGRVVEQLESLGYETLTDIIERGESRLHRVRVGPFDSESNARRARDQIRQTVSGVEPQVMRAPGAVADAPDLDEGRFAVQVGVFSSRENAEALKEQIEGQGFTLFLGEQETGERTIWRVRVGPVSDRDEARTLQEQLEEAGYEGMVVGHP